MRPDRSWMMRRKDSNGQVTEKFKNGVDDFIEIAKRQSGVADVLGRIFCHLNYFYYHFSFTFELFYIKFMLQNGLF
jgi:hypothetical protein